MFERMTDRGRRVVVLAQEEARRLNHNYIGTEHILLGLIREGEGVGSQVLVKLGAELARARREVVTILASYQPPVSAMAAKFSVAEKPKVRIRRKWVVEYPVSKGIYICDTFDEARAACAALSDSEIGVGE